MTARSNARKWWIAAAAMSAIAFASCGSSDSGDVASLAPATTATPRTSDLGLTETSETTTTEAETTTTTAPQPEIELTAGAIRYECVDGMSTLSVFDPATGSELASVQAADCIMYNDVVSSIGLSGSGQFLIAETSNPIGGNDDGFEVMETSTGFIRTFYDYEISEILTEKNGGGLDSRTFDVEHIGFDATDDGKLFFSEDVDDFPVVYQVDVAEAFQSSINPTTLPDARPCHWSSNWSLDGSHCLTTEFTGQSSSTEMFRTSDVIKPTGGFPSTVGYIEFGWYDPVWISGDTLVRGTDYGTKVSLLTAGQTQQDLYEVNEDSDRKIRPVIDRSDGTVYLLSVSLDQAVVETFELGTPESIAEPTVVHSEPNEAPNRYVWYL